MSKLHNDSGRNNSELRKSRPDFWSIDFSPLILMASRLVNYGDSMYIYIYTQGIFTYVWLTFMVNVGK